VEKNGVGQVFPWLTPVLWVAAVIAYGGSVFFLLDFAFSHIANAHDPGADMDRAIGVLFYPGFAVLVASIITASVLRIWDIPSRWIAATALVIIIVLASVSITIAVNSIL
jgi:hypothetical protein